MFSLVLHLFSSVFQMLSHVAHMQVVAEASLPSSPTAHAQEATEEMPAQEAPVMPSIGSLLPGDRDGGIARASLAMEPLEQPPGRPPPGQSPQGRSRSPQPREEPIDIQLARLGLSSKTHMHQCPDLWELMEGMELVLRRLLLRFHEQQGPTMRWIHVIRAGSMTYAILRITRGAHGVRFAAKMLAMPASLQMLLDGDASACSSLQALAKRILEGASRMGMSRSALSHPEGRHLPRSGVYVPILLQSLPKGNP